MLSICLCLQTKQLYFASGDPENCSLSTEMVTCVYSWNNSIPNLWNVWQEKVTHADFLVYRNGINNNEK